MRKKVISLFIAILFVLNCFYPTLTFASPELEAEMFFKYYDISADAYVEEDESLLVGEEYELEVWLKDMGMLFGGCIPVHFNNDVVRIAAYESGEELTEELIGVNAANHIYVMGDWKAEIITTGIDTPVISNTRGLVSVNFCHTDNDAYELSGESRIFSVRFKVIAAGDTEFREATEALDGDDADLVYAPEGAYFAGIDTDGEEYEIEFLPSPEAKYAGYAVERVTLDKETLDLVIGASETLNVTVEPDNAANKKVVWKSDNEAVATVDENGVVTGVATGEAQITVTSVDGGYIDTCKVTVIDENTPTVPQGLTITSKTGKSVEFSWSASTGKSGVDGYNVYRDGELIATVDECKFLDDTGTEGVEYVYTVEAFYGDLVSSASDGLTVILESPKIVEVVPESQEIFGSNQAQKVYVYYKDTFNSDGSSLKVEYKANGAEEYTEYTLTDEEIETGKVTEDVLNYFKFILDPANIENNGNEYIFRYTVTDKDGCTGTMENVVYSIIYPPEAVEEFEATQGARSIIISWNVSDSYYVEKYVLYRKLSGSDNWEAYRTITGKTSTYYEDTNVVMGQEYDYYIVAVDEFGQESEPSVILEKILPGADTEAPTVISLTPNDGSTICGTQDLTAYLYDNIGITKTEFYYSVDDGASWQLLNTYESSATTVTHSLDTTAIAAEVIKVKVITYDVDNNPSNGLVVRSYKIDNEGPDKVTGVAGNADSSTQITLTWNDVEAEDRAYFIVEQKNSDGTFSVVGNKVYDVAGMHIKNLTPGGEYIFRVVAYDKVGNRGIESDECVVSTKLDEQIPVVTKITPDPMKIAEALEMTFVVTDDYAVEKITVQTSTDGIVWNDVEVIPAATKAAKVTFSYTLSIDGYDDGLIWVRAVPMDTAGNENTAPIYNQYMIDTTAPLAPQNVTAIGTDSYIEIKWDEANIEIDDDVTHYIVERSEMEGGLYTVLSDNVTTINYLDYDVKSLTTYFYKVYAVDDMGNVSESSEIVSASKLVDNTPPVIEGILPGNGSRINSSREIEVYTSDNNAVASVTLQYKPADGGSWKTVGTGTAEISDFSLSELNLAEGEYMFRANATDTTGNVCEWSDTYTYTLDNTAPLISNVTVEPDAKSLVVSWNCEPYEDLNGTYLYYRTTDSTSYILAGRRQPSESGEYTCTIEGLSSSKSYVVKISAIDQAGNEAAFETNKSGEGLESGVDGSGGIGLDTSEEENVPLEISINAPSDLTVGAEAKFELKVEKGSIDDVASCSWDFGDGTTSSAFSVTHSYDTTDTFTVTLTAYDKNGNKATAAKEVTVSEAEDLGKVILSVIDDTGSVVPDAMVVFNCTDSEKMVHYTTDSTGKLTITAAPGEYEIGFYKDGYLPAQKRVKIINNAAEEKIVGIVKKNIVIC
ncbi:MAG: fibronectin type III domain-containing protein [Clostridia bacterium]|nr:fibronectin type III domain-containing protein [Clostridia bacterium]